MKTDLNPLEVPLNDLMQGNKNIILLHDDKRYALSITRRGKLILTADEIIKSVKISHQEN